MKVEVYASDPLNSQASVLQDAQTDIKTAIKNGFLNNLPADKLRSAVKDIIDKAINRIRSPTLQQDGRRSLMTFADRLYDKARVASSSIPAVALPYIVILMRGITSTNATGKYYKPQSSTEKKAVRFLVDNGELSYDTLAKGVPLQEFQKTYMGRVDDVLGALAEENAKDPNDYRGYNSLRNLAEMQVRYENHQQSITDLKASGTRLVVCSVHGDCSDRCAPYQGRVYSLDGSRGRTKDGRDYVPLEEATDIYYTTKAGRTYKNGLLGFNCRHKLYPYEEGMVIPSVTKEEQQREYAITQTQRRLERDVIHAREEALAYKGANQKLYGEWRQQAIKCDKVYREFSKAHNRPYYPDRTKIL